MLANYDRMLYSNCPNCGEAFRQYIPYNTYFIITYECQTYVSYNFECKDYNEKITKTNICKENRINDRKKITK